MKLWPTQGSSQVAEQNARCCILHGKVIPQNLLLFEPEETIDKQPDFVTGKRRTARSSIAYWKAVVGGVCVFVATISRNLLNMTVRASKLAVRAEIGNYPLLNDRGATPIPAGLSSLLYLYNQKAGKETINLLRQLATKNRILLPVPMREVKQLRSKLWLVTTDDPERFGDTAHPTKLGFSNR